MKRYVSSILLVLFFMPLSVFANGVFMIVKGDIQIQRAKNNQIEKAKIGSKIFPKDTVIAGKDARAKIVMVDKNILNISPDTKMVIEEYSYKPNANEKNVVLNLVYGKVRSQVKQKYDDKDNSFRVKTPSAVAGVRGTDFFVGYVNRESSVVTFSGAVAVGSGLDASGAITNPVSVLPGQFTTAGPSAPPTQPASLPPAQLNMLEKESKPETATGAPAPTLPTVDPKDAKKDSKAPAPAPAADSKDAKKDIKAPMPAADASKDKKEDKAPLANTRGANAGPGNRLPASTGNSLPPPPPPSTERPNLDLGPGVPRAYIPEAPPLPSNSLINEVIQQGNTRVLIQITPP